MPADDNTDLLSLDDQLNLTGRVSRVGSEAVARGGFADIWEGLYQGKKVAVKVIREIGKSRESLTRRLVRETRAWSKLYHRNVLPLYGFTFGFGHGHLFSMVSPWMPHGTACSYLKDKSTHERFRVATEVADGLSYLHRHDVVHGDLKGDNILIGDRGEARLADFGLSKLHCEVHSGGFNTTSMSVLGSIRWMARELLGVESDTPQGVTCESDVWAYGMTVLELFTSLPPYHYEKNDIRVILYVHEGCTPEYPGQNCGLNEDLWQLCNDCWHSHTGLRPTMRVVAKRMWELDLKAKLRGQKRRSSSEEWPTSTNSYCEALESPRVLKSPKLALSDDPEGFIHSPGSPRSIPSSIPNALVPSPVPRTRTASMSMSSSSHANQINPRQLLASHHSEWDAYTQWHPHRIQEIRRSSAPTSPTSRQEVTGLGLALDTYLGSGHLTPDPLPFDDSSSALVSLRTPHIPSPLRMSTHSGEWSPRLLEQEQEGAYEYANSASPDNYRYDHDEEESEGRPYVNGTPGSEYLGYDQPIPDAQSSYPDFLLATSASTPEPQDSLPGSAYIHSLEPDLTDPPLFGQYFVQDPLLFDDDRLLYNASQFNGSQPVDFTSMSQDVWSPALSDITPSATPLQTTHHHFPALESDSPVIASDDFGDFGDLGSLFASGDSLFGGIYDEDQPLTPQGTPKPRPAKLSPHLTAYPLRPAPDSPRALRTPTAILLNA